MPPPARVVVSSQRLGDFEDALERLEGDGAESRSRAEEIRRCLIVDGALDQARRLPDDLMARYLSQEDGTDEAVADAAPLSTYRSICLAAAERGIPVP